MEEFIDMAITNKKGGAASLDRVTDLTIVLGSYSGFPTP